MNILMPQLGETVAEGKITKWFKSAGDAVKPGDNLFEIETDKVSMEVPATEAGVLSEIRVPEGEIAPVGAIVGVIGDAAAASQPRRNVRTAAAQAPKTPARARHGCTRIRPTARRRRSTAAANQARSVLRGAHAGRAISDRRGFPGGVTVTPLARRLAAEAGIDLSRLRGSGPHGRIVARDVESAPRPRPRHAAVAEGPSAEQVKALYDPASYEEVPLDGMRKTIAARLAAGQADHSAFLPDRRYHDRPPEGGARRGQCSRAERSRRQSGVQALAQRFHHPRAGAGSAARAGGECGVGGRPHPALQAFRHRRCGRARRRPDRADHPQRRNQIAERDLGRNEGSGGARPRQEAQARTNTRAARRRSPISACTACANSPPSSTRRMRPSSPSAPRAGRRSRQPDGGVAFASMLTATLSCDHRVVDGALGAELLAAIKALIEDAGDHAGLALGIAAGPA